jgi:hypothetical protein
MAQQNSVDINVNLQGNAEQSIGNVKKALKEANAELINAQSNFGDYSDQAIAAAKRVAELKDKISEAKETADLFDPGKKFQVFAGAINAVAGGFTAVQGALGIVGAESEELQKSLLKVQSALALSQGLSAITDSAKDFQRLATIVKTNVVTAFSTLRGALIATGIGALAIGVALVAANFDKVKKAVLNLIPGLAQVGTFFSNIITKVTDFVGVTSAAERALDSLEKSTKRGNESIAARIKILTAQGGKEKEIYELTKQQGDAELNALRQRLATKGKLTEEEQKRFRDLGVERQVLDAQENKRREDNAQQAADKAKALSDKLAEENATRLQKQIDDEKKITEDLLAEYDKRRNAANNAKILSQKELNALDEQERVAEEEKNNKKFDAQISFLGKTTNFTLQGIQQQQKANADAKEAEAKIDKISAEQKIALAQQTASALMAVSDVLGKETAAGKALAISAALINTYQGISAGVKLGFPAAIPAVALAAATGFSAVKNIIATKVPGAASVGGANMTAPSVSASAPITPPQPQAATTNLSNQTINAIGNQAIRSYVVESDVTSNQQRIAAIQQRARFG